MSSKLLLAPAAGGKTQSAIDRILALSADSPPGSVWAVVPDRNQGMSLQKRLATHGALGVRVETFGDLYAEILSQAGEPFPVTPEPVIHLLLRAAIDRVAERGQLRYYAPIRHRPGLVGVLADLFAELKRSLIEPAGFSSAMRGRGARLEELAAFYEEYQARLVKLGWSDHEGLGWLAVNALAANPQLTRDWRLLVIDGFDSFNTCQIALLKALEPRVRELLLTLTGDLKMSRLAYRRFARTMEALQSNLSLEVQVLPIRRNPVRPLAHLEESLFQTNVGCERMGANVTFVEAQNMSLEAREALRWVKARIARDGVALNQCAVIARDIGSYRQALHEAAREFGLPLRLACGEPLIANPAVAAVLNLLELSLQDWARRPLLDVLRTPYFDLSLFGFSHGDAVQLDEIARAGQVVGGIDQWQEALLLAAAERDSSREEFDEEEQRPPRRPIGSAALALWERLRAFHERLTPPAQGSLKDYARWVEDLLPERSGVQLASCLAAQADTAERDKAAVGAFVKALGALVLGESVVERSSTVSFAEFYAQLRASVEAATYRLDDFADPTQGQIYGASLATARGVCYRAVAIMGLSEGLLPAPLNEDPLLSDEDRDECVKSGLPLEPRLRSDQQTLFYEGVTRATEYLLLSRPYLADDGEVWEPSHYWAAALSLFDAPVQRVRPEDIRPHVEAASPAELLAWCVRRRSLPGGYRNLLPEWETLRGLWSVLRARLDSDTPGECDGNDSDLRSALAGRFGPDHIWSPSRLETYAACPFSFYMSVALGLEERKPPELGFDAAQLGSMLHEVLEGVYRQAGNGSQIEDLLAALPSVAQAVFEAAPRKFGFRPTPFWETQRQELMESLSRSLPGLASQSGAFRPAHFELQFGLAGASPLAIETDEGSVLFHRVIDRVDLDQEGNLRIIDYKTGSSGLRPRDLIEGHRLQLPIYSLAAQKSLGLGRPVDGFYWAILRGEAGQLRLQGFEHVTEDGRVFRGALGAMDLAAEHIGNFLRGIREAAFAPLPPSGGCKGYCVARQFCWRYQPEQW